MTGTADAAGRALNTEFVKEGFCWPAFVLGPLWLALYRLWKPLALVATGVGLAEVLLWALGADGQAMAIPVLVTHMLIGFEASDIRRWQLELNGYQETSVIGAASLDECELRHFGGRFEGSQQAPSVTPSAGQVV